jgi:glutathione synthase/RimK-type ligase-like ATP-grasp enzyme
MILIFSHPGDDHANGVIAELDRRGHPATLVDSSHFPAQSSLNQTFSLSEVCVEYVTDGHRVDLSECRAAWWRRPQPYTLHDDLDPDVMSFAYTECHEAFTGALALLDATWVNPPHLDERAHHKPFQLATAVRVGLTIPRTLVSNSPDEARRFIADIAPSHTIYKTFLATEDHWRETRILRDEELSMLELVRFAPVIFQERIVAEADIRVTIVGGEMFATAIRSDPCGYSLDYRMDMDAASFTPTELPEDVKKPLRDLMRRLGIVYGAVDLLRTSEGQYIFLEVNPAGEWRFVEDRTAQPITSAMADLLIQLDVN